MTIPYERTQAILGTKEFLENLIDPRKTPKVPEEIRIWAGRCLRHYPTRSDLQITNQGFNNSIIECPIGNPDEKPF